MTIWTQPNFGLDFSQLTVLVTQLKRLYAESLRNSSLPEMMVKYLFSLSKILVLHLVPLTVAFLHRLEYAFGIQNPLFRSFSPIWPTESKLRPFLVTVQIHPLSIMVYSKVHLSIPYCFICTQNHSHKSLTDTRFPIVNLLTIVMQLYNSVPREHLRSLISNMHSCVSWCENLDDVN